MYGARAYLAYLGYGATRLFQDEILRGHGNFWSWKKNLPVPYCHKYCTVPQGPVNNSGNTGPGNEKQPRLKFMALYQVGQELSDPVEISISKQPLAPCQIFAMAPYVNYGILVLRPVKIHGPFCQYFKIICGLI